MWYIDMGNENLMDPSQYHIALNSAPLQGHHLENGKGEHVSGREEEALIPQDQATREKLWPLIHNTRVWLQRCIVSDVSSMRSARAQAAEGQQKFQQIANHCWLTAAAVVRVRQAKPNEYSWSRIFFAEMASQFE